MSAHAHALARVQLELDAGMITPEIAAAAAQAASWIADCRAPNTRKLYEQQWAAWVAHCRARGICPRPVSPVELVVYLTQLSMGTGTRPAARPNSVRSALTAISVIDQLARVTDDDPDPMPVRSDQRVKAWQKGYARAFPRGKETRAPAMTGDELERILRAAQERPKNVSASAHVAAYARDRAMLLAGITAALRVSELVALDVDDVRLVERGIVLRVLRRKTAGEYVELGVMPSGRAIRCPVDAILSWRRIRGERPGALFVGVSRDGSLSEERLTDSSARRLVERRAQAAGIDLTSHSLRATFATLATVKRVPITTIMKHGGWQSVSTVKDYVRQGNLFDDNPTSGILDD